MSESTNEREAELRAQWWADVAALMNDRADMWEQEGNRPCETRECRGLANAFRTYAEGVGIPQMDTLRRKRREAEATVARVEALLRCPCGAGHETPAQFSIRSADLRAALKEEA